MKPQSSDGAIDPRREFIDRDHYRSQLDRRGLRRLRRRDDDVLTDYVEDGWREGHDPSSTFSTAGYLHDNADVAASGMDPLTHWVQFGRNERRPIVSPAEFADPSYRTKMSEQMTERFEGLSEVLAAEGIEIDRVTFQDAIEKGVDPPEWFDPEYYLTVNLDVREAGLDPFVHYLLEGHRERRRPNAANSLDSSGAASRIDRVLAARDVRTRTALRLEESGPGPKVAAGTVVDAIVAAVGSTKRGIVVAIGHDDYRRHVGGVQLCQGIEEREFDARGVAYVQIHPAIPLETMFPADRIDARVRVVVDGLLIEGELSLTELSREWRQRSGRVPPVRAIAVHSVLGHDSGGLITLHGALRPERSVWWLHDRTGHCSSWCQARNDVERCGDPDPTSQMCRVCVYGAERHSHLERLAALWSIAEWEFAAPSRWAADSSTMGSTPIPGIPVVVPHVRLVQVGTPRVDRPRGERLRLAFIGHPVVAKGWDVFVEFARSRRDEFELHHLGAWPTGESGVEFHLLRQTAANLGSTARLIADLELDAVLMWPMWAETFSFVAAEAMVGGAAVLTSPNSGNIVAMAELHRRAVVVDDLESLLTADDLADRIRRVRAGSSALAFGPFDGLTPALLPETRARLAS